MIKNTKRLGVNVSYTHLDVYKRQGNSKSCERFKRCDSCIHHGQSQRSGREQHNDRQYGDLK